MSFFIAEPTTRRFLYIYRMYVQPRFTRHHCNADEQWAVLRSALRRKDAKYVAAAMKELYVVDLLPYHWATAIAEDHSLLPTRLLDQLTKLISAMEAPTVSQTPNGFYGTQDIMCK